MLLEQQVRSFVISSSERCHSEICKVSALTLGQTWARIFFSTQDLQGFWVWGSGLDCLSVVKPQQPAQCHR